MASQAQNGVDRSAIALGLGFSQWTRNDLSVILNQYGVRPAIGDSNNTLIDKLNQLALERGLTRVDRLAILKAHKAGLRLPPRRPLVRDPTSSLAPPQNAAPPPVITHTEDYSSGANDDSDVEVSDDELVEELVSLSEEERDLREYTATMSLPRNSEQRRTLRPRSAANPIANRPMSTSLPEAMIYPPVRHRPAVRNRPVRSTLPNRSVAARTRVSSNLRRSGSAVANRTVTTSSLRLRGLARPQVVNHTISTQANSRPATLKTNQAAISECIICYSSFDLAKTVMRRPTSSCKHETNVCKPCLSASISSQLDSKLWTRISCPTSDCEELLEYRDIQEFAEPQIFTR